MAYQQVLETDETIKAKQEASIQNALDDASQKLTLVVEKWTELYGTNNPIAHTQLTNSKNLYEIKQFTEKIQRLNQAADIGKDALRILDHPSLPMLLGLESTRKLEENTQNYISSIAQAATEEREISQYTNQLQDIHTELRNAEHKLNEITNPLSTHNRKIDRNLRTVNDKTEMQLYESSSWNVNSMVYLNEIQYLSKTKQAHLRNQQQSIKTQVTYNPPDPPLTLVEKVVTDVDIDSVPVQPIQITLFIERATQGFRALLMEGDKKPIHLSILPVKVEQVVELGKRIRDAIESNLKFERYSFPEKKFSQSELQEDWKKLADIGSTILEEIFDPASLEQLKKHLGRTNKPENHLPLSIRIETEDFFLPWEMLAWPEISENEPLEYRFWGFLYNISRSVIDAEQKITKPQLIADTRPDMLFFTWQDNDPQVIMMEKFQQQEFVNLSRVLPLEMSKREQDIKDLPIYFEKPLHIVHFGCHAEGAESEDLAKFRVNNNFDLKLSDFIANNCKLRGNPLVFMNACATGIFGNVSSNQTSNTMEDNNLTPKVAADFVRVFLRDLGACGIIATEYEIPMDFAPAFAREFYLEFLSGKQNAGEALLRARQKFLERCNPLGLYFSAYLEPETSIFIQHPHLESETSIFTQHPQRSIPMNISSRTFIVADKNTTVSELTTSAFNSPPEYVIVIPSQGKSNAKFGILSFAALKTVSPETLLLKHPKLHMIGENQILEANAKNEIKEKAVATHGTVILTKGVAPVKILVPEKLGEEYTPVSGLASMGLGSDICPNCKESAERLVARVKGKFKHYCSNCAQLWA